MYSRDTCQPDNVIEKTESRVNDDGKEHEKEGRMGEVWHINRKKKKILGKHRMRTQVLGTNACSFFLFYFLFLCIFLALVYFFYTHVY